MAWVGYLSLWTKIALNSETLDEYNGLLHKEKILFKTYHDTRFGWQQKDTKDGVMKSVLLRYLKEILDNFFNPAFS